MQSSETIQRLEAFKALLLRWLELSYSAKGALDLRAQINQEKNWVRRQVIAARCFKTLTITPAPAVGGLVMQRVDPFAMIFESPQGFSLMAGVVDLVNEEIG